MKKRHGPCNWINKMDTFPGEWRNMEVILAHDWLTGMRGGERVLQILCRVFPRAPIYTLFYNPGAVSPSIRARRVITSPLQRVPGILKSYRNFLPFFPAAIESFRLPKADLVISTSHCAAKGIIPPQGARHLCYCFTPMRYAWVFYGEYFGNNPLKRMILQPVLARLRRWDRENSARVDRFVTLSNHVKKRINDFYNRDADVVYPPVDLSFWTPGVDGNGGYDLVVSALVPYKRIDLAVKAYNKLGRALKIAGTGTEARKLSAMAGKTIEFLGRVPDERLLELYRHCRCLVFPGEEDFGLVPLEAQACGKPVVAFGKGGALETVVDGATGVFFKEQNPEALCEAVSRCDALAWDSALIRKNAGRFSEQSFIDGLSASIRLTMENK